MPEKHSIRGRLYRVGHGVVFLKMAQPLAMLTSRPGHEVRWMTQQLHSWSIKESRRPLPRNISSRCTSFRVCSMKPVTVGTKRKNFSFRVQEQMWVISHTKQRMVPVATWRDLKRWNVATGSVKAPVQVLPVRLLKSLLCTYSHSKDSSKTCLDATNTSARTQQPLLQSLAEASALRD